MALDAAFYGFSTADEAKAAWLEQVARIALQNLSAGVIIDDILPSAPAEPEVVDSDADSTSRLWQTWRALDGGTITTSQVQTQAGTWYELLPPGTDQFAGQLAYCLVDYQAAVHAAWKALADAINACATADDVLAVDLSAGWPSRTCALVTLPTGGGVAEVDLPYEIGGGSVVEMTDASTQYLTGAYITIPEDGRWLVTAEATVYTDGTDEGFMLQTQIVRSTDGIYWNPIVGVTGSWPAVTGDVTFATQHMSVIATLYAGDFVDVGASSSIAACWLASSTQTSVYAVRIGPAPPPM